MKWTTDIEDQIDAIRDEIYEEIKDMTPAEHVTYFNSIVEEAQMKYNFQVIKAPQADSVQPEKSSVFAQE